MERKQNTEIETFCPASRQEWRQWLQQHHSAKQSVWVVYYKKHSGIASMPYSDAVDEALCFGWIDSTRKTLDSESFIQFFCKRKPKSVWSKVNKAKVQRLMEEGLMMPAGLTSINTAKQNGSWTILDSAEELEVPKDLIKAFKSHPGSNKYFTGLSKSVRKAMLQWLVLARRPETRQKRIDEIAGLSAQGKKPKQF